MDQNDIRYKEEDIQLDLVKLRGKCKKGITCDLIGNR